MSAILRSVTTLLGVFFALQGAAWLAVPERAAAGLGMPLLEGLGRSTQVGDFAAFFLVTGATMVLGARPGRAALLYVPAALLGSAAIGRTLAFVLHGADFAAVFIAVELATAALLVTAGQTRRAR